jgi:hypothetical protein
VVKRNIGRRKLIPILTEGNVHIVPKLSKSPVPNSV